MIPASSCSHFPSKTKTFKNTCLIMMKRAINSKIQNKMPLCLMAKKRLLCQMFQFYLPYTNALTLVIEHTDADGCWSLGISLYSHAKHAITCSV